MSVDLTQDVRNKKTYVIRLAVGDNIEIRINDSPVINATVSTGTQGTVRLEYMEVVV